MSLKPDAAIVIHLQDEIDTLKSELAASKLEASRLERRIDKLRGNLAEHLATQYESDPVEVARLCDEVLDRSGVLLGMVRDLAMARRKEAP